MDGVDVGEIIRTVDGGLTIAVLLYVSRKMMDELKAVREEFQKILWWSLNRTDIPK